MLMTRTEIIELIKRELPTIYEEDPEMRQLLEQLVSAELAELAKKNSMKDITFRNKPVGKELKS